MHAVAAAAAEDGCFFCAILCLYLLRAISCSNMTFSLWPFLLPLPLFVVCTFFFNGFTLGSFHELSFALFLFFSVAFSFRFLSLPYLFLFPFLPTLYPAPSSCTLLISSSIPSHSLFSPSPSLSPSPHPLPTPPFRPSFFLFPIFTSPLPPLPHSPSPQLRAGVIDLV